MSSFMENGEMLLERMFQVSAVMVSYHRDGEELAAQIPAKLGKTLFRADDEYGVTIRTEQRDFIVRCSDFPAGFVPKNGDEVHYCGRMYQVGAPNGEPCWKFHTRTTHSQLRIHSSFTGEV